MIPFVLTSQRESKGETGNDSIFIQMLPGTGELLLYFRLRDLSYNLVIKIVYATQMRKQ